MQYSMQPSPELSMRPSSPSTGISFAEIQRAADMLNVEPCAVKAVVDVESSGSGFLPDGRLKILFEGHVFWKELEKRDIDPVPLSKDHPDILYPRWTRSRYKGGPGEHVRLERAKAVHEEAALCSASWGLFQIMGFNYAACGFLSVFDFVERQQRGEYDQLLSFCALLNTRWLSVHLGNRHWEAFARGYNGPGYRANQYDRKLREAYDRCKNTL